MCLVRRDTAHAGTWPWTAGEIESRGWREVEPYPGGPGPASECQGLTLRAGCRMHVQVSSASILSLRHTLSSTPTCSGEVAGHLVHPGQATDDGHMMTWSGVTGVSYATGAGHWFGFGISM